VPTSKKVHPKVKLEIHNKNQIKKGIQEYKQNEELALKIHELYLDIYKKLK